MAIVASDRERDIGDYINENTHLLVLRDGFPIIDELRFEVVWNRYLDLSSTRILVLLFYTGRNRWSVLRLPTKKKHSRGKQALTPSPSRPRLTLLLSSLLAVVALAENPAPPAIPARAPPPAPVPVAIPTGPVPAAAAAAAFFAFSRSNSFCASRSAASLALCCSMRAFCFRMFSSLYLFNLSSGTHSSHLSESPSGQQGPRTQAERRAEERGRRREGYSRLFPAFVMHEIVRTDCPILVCRFRPHLSFEYLCVRIRYVRDEMQRDQVSQLRDRRGFGRRGI